MRMGLHSVCACIRSFYLHQHLVKFTAFSPFLDLAPICLFQRSRLKYTNGPVRPHSIERSPGHHVIEVAQIVIIQPSHRCRTNADPRPSPSPDKIFITFNNSINRQDRRRLPVLFSVIVCLPMTLYGNPITSNPDRAFWRRNVLGYGKGRGGEGNGMRSLLVFHTCLTQF